MIEIFQSSGEPVPLKNGELRKYKGTRLPGAELWQSAQANWTLYLHYLRAVSFSLSLRSIQCINTTSVIMKELNSQCRFETVLNGQLVSIDEAGGRQSLLAGQYRFCDRRRYRVMLEASAGCQYFLIFLGPELLEQPFMREHLCLDEAKALSLPMREIIEKILANPFENNFRDWFYDNSIRELLFRHASMPPSFLPGELTPAEIAAVYEADRIIAGNLNRHYTIQELSRMVHTNAFTLKNAFVRVMGLGMFERLQELKMERAKELLASTDLQIQMVSDMAGYETVTGFINSFRKQFGMTPKDWRKKSRGQDSLPIV